VDINADRRDERPAHSTGSNPRGRLARAGALEDVAGVIEPVLQDPRKVGVAGAYARHPLGFESARLHLHGSLPVLPVTVRDHEGDRRSKRLATAHAADDLRGVVLDLLTLASPMTTLTATQIGINITGRVEWQACRDPFDDHRELGAV
jgi:hypothetical protein